MINGFQDIAHVSSFLLPPTLTFQSASKYLKLGRLPQNVTSGKGSRKQIILLRLLFLPDGLVYDTNTVLVYCILRRIHIVATLGWYTPQ